MAYDQELAERVRRTIGPAEEKPMFGGLGFLTEGGHLAVCVSSRGVLVVRVPAEDQEALLGDHVTPMTMAGRSSRTWVEVEPAAIELDVDLDAWIRRGLDVAQSLPPKR